MFSPLVTLTFLLPLLAQQAQAGLFTKDSPVKMLDQKLFKRAMAQNRTAVVAFVAPWCGHCQRMTPEYEKAATRLAPLVPLYAIDCDAETNKPLCAQEGVRGFPTVKLFKKGGRLPGTEYQGERSQQAIYNWAKASVPDTVHKVKNGLEGIGDWSYKNNAKPRAILLNKSNKLPLLWVVIANQFSPTMSFATVRDRRGKVSKAMGFPYNEDHRKPKVILYEAGKKEPVMYEGLLKYDALRDFLKKFAKGEADVSGLLKAVKEEKESVPEREMREQEAEAIMQGKGYGNPHAGMPVGEDGLPAGKFNHDEFMKAHGGGAGMPHGHNPHAAHGGHGHNPHAAHGGQDPHGHNPHTAHGGQDPHGHNPHAAHGGHNPHAAHSGQDPHAYAQAHGGAFYPIPPTGGEEAQKVFNDNADDDLGENGKGEDKEMGADDEESVGDGMGRDTTDEL